MKKTNRRLSAVLITLTVMLLLLVILFFAFQISNVEVTGNEQYTAEEIKSYVLSNSFDNNSIVLYIKTKLGMTKDIPFVQKYSVQIKSFNTVKITVYEKDVAGYIEYMGHYMYFDKDGLVVESSDEIIEGVPLVSGLKYDYIILGENIPVENEEVFNMLLEVSQMLTKVEITVDKIYVAENLDVTLSIGSVRVNLGQDDLNEKLSDLKDMYDNLEGYSGTLDMMELDTDGHGYTMKVDN